MARRSAWDDSPDRPGTVMGRPRWMWVRDASRALESSMDAPLMLNVLAAGFDEFLRVARPRFQKALDIRFTEDEMRWIFRRLSAKVMSMPRLFSHGVSESGVAAKDIVDTNSVKHGDRTFEVKH